MTNLARGHLERRGDKPVEMYPHTVVYPDSDGKPLGETGWHFAQIIYLAAALMRHLTDDPTASVGGDLIFYYEEEDPTRAICPDIWVARGLDRPKALRRIFKLWEEKKAPDLIVEIGSKSTRHRDRFEKKILYQDLFRTKEYLIFEADLDDAGSIVRHELLGYRLRDGIYVPAKVDGERFESEVCGGSFAYRDGFLRLFRQDGSLVPGDPIEGRVEGREEGRGEGREEGRGEGRRETLLTIARAQLTNEQVDALAATTDVDALERRVLELLRVRDGR